MTPEQQKQFDRNVELSQVPFWRPGEKRRLERQHLSEDLMGKAEEVQSEINRERAKDPFETAGAKAGMARAQRGAKTFQKRLDNTLGAGATAEARLAQQGRAAESVAAAAGNIATGAEAQKQSNINMLKGQKSGYESASTAARSGAIDERGSDWKMFMDSVDSIANIATAGGNVFSAIKDQPQ